MSSLSQSPKRWKATARFNGVFSALFGALLVAYLYAGYIHPEFRWSFPWLFGVVTSAFVAVVYGVLAKWAYELGSQAADAA